VGSSNGGGIPATVGRHHLTERSRRLEPVLKGAANRINALVTLELTVRQLRAFMRTVESLISEASRLDAQGTE
jgi:hypothetical protein